MSAARATQNRSRRGRSLQEGLREVELFVKKWDNGLVRQIVRQVNVSNVDRTPVGLVEGVMCLDVFEQRGRGRNWFSTVIGAWELIT